MRAVTVEAYRDSGAKPSSPEETLELMAMMFQAAGFRVRIRGTHHVTLSKDGGDLVLRIEEVSLRGVG